MKTVIKFSALLLAFVSVFSNARTDIPDGAYGLLSAETLTQGKLMWLKGRVGEALYTVRMEDGHTCTMTLPVAIGSIKDADSGMRVETADGFSIAVMNKALSRALMQGDRINSQDWQFDTTSTDPKADGWVLSGISGEEGFVLNSRRRWIAWIMGDNYPSDCL